MCSTWNSLHGPHSPHENPNSNATPTLFFSPYIIKGILVQNKITSFYLAAAGTNHSKNFLTSPHLTSPVGSSSSSKSESHQESHPTARMLPALAPGTPIPTPSLTCHLTCSGPQPAPPSPLAAHLYSPSSTPSHRKKKTNHPISTIVKN